MTVEKQTAASARVADSPKTLKQEIAAQKSRRDLPISGLCIPGIAGIWEYPDANVLRFICEQINQERCHLADVALESNDAELLSHIAELLHIAGAVTAQKPPCGELWGIAQIIKLDSGNVLAEVCLRFYTVRRAIIQKSRQQYTNPRDQIGLAHALVVAERIVERNGIATDLENHQTEDDGSIITDYSRQKKHPTLVQQWAWTVTTKVARLHLECASNGLLQI